MLFVLGVVLFAVLIAVSIALHEIGHLLPAKRFGVRVPQYMVGFGPTIWSKRTAETEYGVKAIPLGGYIRMIGMYPPASERHGGEPQGRLATMVESAREANDAEIEPGDEHRVFYRLSTPKKLAVMLGGPTMNLLLAFVLFAIVLVGIGIPTPSTTARLVVPRTPTATNLTGAAEDGQCRGSAPSPAAAAGLKPGDTITSIAGTPVTTWTELTAAIRASAPPSGETTSPVEISYERDGESQTTTAELVLAPRPVIDGDGVPTDETELRPFLGIAPSDAYVRQGLLAVPQTVWDISVRSVQALVGLPVKVYELAVTVFTNGDRDPNGPVSVVGVSRLGGEVTAAEEPIAYKAAGLLTLAASLNLFLFLFNLVPVLPLDGGHVAGALYEGGRRRWSRWRGKPDPGPVDLTRMLPVAYGVSVILIGLSVLVIYADLFKPITLGG